MDLIPASLVLLGLGGAAARRRLAPGLGVSLFVAAVSLATGMVLFRLNWPLAGVLPLLVRIGAALSAIWAVCGWATRRDAPDATDPYATRPAGAACFFAGAMATGVLSVILLIYSIVNAMLARLLEPSYPFAEPLLYGSIDILTLGAALLFWRRARRDRIQPTLALFLGALLALCAGLRIPGNVIGDPVESVLPAPTEWPAWWTWTLVSQIGLGAVVTAAAIIRDRRYRTLRARAWPEDLDALLIPYPSWPGFSSLYSLVAAGCLVLGVYHVIRPGAVNGLGGPLSFLSGLAAGVACLHTAHRRWNQNLAGLGLALLTGATVTLAVIVAPLDPTAEYAGYLPVQLNAVLLGLCPAALVLFCLSDFWDQQLLDGRAWTTTGRLIPHCWRAGFLITALGVLVGIHMALWPRGHLTVARDDSLARWIAGEFALLLLTFTAGWSAVRRHRESAADEVLIVRTRDPGLAMMAVIALIGALLFALVRWPSNDARGWAVQHAALLLAIASLPVLAAAEALPRTRAAVFAPPLWFLALLVMPALALAQCLARPATEWLRPLTFAALACTYAIAATREGRRLFLIPAAALLAAAAWSVMGQFQVTMN